MTITQDLTVANLKLVILLQSNSAAGKLEYKAFRVMQMPGDRGVLVHAIVGLAKEKSSISAALFRREHVIWIGPRGKVTWITDTQMQASAGTEQELPQLGQALNRTAH